MPYYFPYWCILLSAVFVASCGSIKMQHNPFQMEADAIQAYKENRKHPPNPGSPGTSQEPDFAAADPQAEPSPVTYFGQDQPKSATSSLLPKLKKRDAPSKPSPQAPTTNPDASPPVERSTSGKVCYACNGKGYSFSPQNGQKEICGNCGGDGRQ